ncbi:MAG: RagB/SusD family nutrient uptake outer membrane protein [Bacteroidales bacterium]
MKTIRLYIFLTLIGVLAISCDSILDIDTKHALPEEKITTVEGAEGMVIGVYDLLQSPLYFGRDMITLPEVLGDNVKLSISASRYKNQYSFQPRAQIDIWTTAYSQIGSLNEAIVNLNKLDQGPKVKAVLGEAQFLRAFNYFYLAMTYSRVPAYLVGGFDLCVPLILEPFYNSGGNISETASEPRSTVTAVWNQIEADLKDAFANLENNDAGMAPARISAIGVKAFMSRFYLYKEDWQNSVDAATYVINNSSIPVYTGAYREIFSKGAESLFQLVYTTSDNLGSSSLQAMYGTYDDGFRDADGFGNGKGSGEANLSLSNEFMAAIDQTNDTRFTVTRKVRESGQELWWTTKYNSWGGIFGLDNIPLIRISEVYLNRAEAYAQLKSYDLSRADVNHVRTKRNIGETVATNANLLNEVLLQRRLELAFEGHRFFDMKRMGKPITRPDGSPTIPYEDYRVVAPIGVTELDVNKKLVNNPGY